MRRASLRAQRTVHLDQTIMMLYSSAMTLLTRSDLGDLNLFRAVARIGGFIARRWISTCPPRRSAMRSGDWRRGWEYACSTAPRSITLTQAGQELLASLEAGFGAVEQGLDGLNRYRQSPAGRLRINVLTDVARLLLGSALARVL
jgi:hypothetical protein